MNEKTDTSVQKSVANNLDDLYKEKPGKFEEILATWRQPPLMKVCRWIIHQAECSKGKQAETSAK